MHRYEKINSNSKICQVAHHSDKKIIAFKNQIYSELKSECIESGKLFEDPHFLAEDKSIFYNQPIPKGTKWARPGEISKTPIFIDNIADSNDLDQGYLGDCI